MHLRVASNKNAPAPKAQPCFHVGCASSFYFLARADELQPTYSYTYIYMCAHTHAHTTLRTGTRTEAIHTRILAANNFPRSTITTFRARQPKFLNGTFKSSHNRRQSRVAFAIQYASRHPFPGSTFRRAFRVPLGRILCAISEMANE